CMCGATPARWPYAPPPSLPHPWGRRLPRAFFFPAEDGIRGLIVTGVQTCALPIFDVGFALLPLAGDLLDDLLVLVGMELSEGKKIGRASCRERVWLWVVDISG